MTRRLRAEQGLRLSARLLCAWGLTTSVAYAGTLDTCDLPVLTLGEAAELLRVDQEEMLRLAERSEVPARRIGGAWRFNCSALMEWLNGDWELIDTANVGNAAKPTSFTALQEGDPLGAEDLAALTATGAGAGQAEAGPASNPTPTPPAGQDQPIGEAPEERTAEDIFLRAQRVLLAPGEFSFDLGQFYSERASRELAPVDSGTVLGTVDQEAFITTVHGRIGIHEETELFASTSYFSQDSDVLFGSATLASTSRSEFGDLRFGVRRTLLREDLGRPSIVATVDGHIPTGETSYAIGGGLAFVKSVDPAALFASVNYRHTFSEEFDDLTRLEPEERLDVNFGYALALNDTLSLSASISAFFTGATRFANAELPRQDGYSLSLGFTSWLANGVYIEPGVSLRLGGPDDSFSFGVTVFTFPP